MEMRGKRILVCSCEGTMPLNGGKLAKACAAIGATGGADGDLEINSQLCRAQLEVYQRALLSDQPLLIACTQEAPLFADFAAEESANKDIAFVNIRERAGWSAEAADATPKIAALIAEAALDIESTTSVSMESGGTCLVYGKDERAIEAAKQLADRLDVTVLLDQPKDVLPPWLMDVPIFKGRITQAKGHLGQFGITVDDYAPASPSSRARLSFEAPKDNAFSECDLILDLSGGTPLFPEHDRRDGYLRPDPGNPAAVQKAIFDIADMVGEYEKPRYVRYDSDICAHSRSGMKGCTRCLDVCPTSAITSAGDSVAIDPLVCAGCGSCNSVCPTGAISYQLPAGDGLFQRLRQLLSVYGGAGGSDPVILLHDSRHGDDMIATMARLGRGLPARVLPFAVNEITQIGFDFLSMALAYGAAQIAILVGQDKAGELEGLAQQIGLAETVMEGLGYGGGRILVLDDQDPEAIEASLYGLQIMDPAPAGTFLPMGEKRTRTMLALRHLYDKAPQKTDFLPLPAGAPFGAVNVDTAGCTLCLACVSTCPTGALLDDPERPWLGFQEEACVQCGLCQNTCPEKVISLEPRINFTDSGKGAVVLNEAEPFNCVRCGKPFGVQSTIEKITEQLAGKHSMFADSDAIERIKMCDDCRVVAQFDQGKEPFAAGLRPTIRTTDDDLRERDIEEARAKVLAERAKPNGGGE